MRIYLAAQFARRAELCEYRKQLIALGHDVQARWLDETGSEAMTEDAQREWALRDIDDCTAADCLIAFTEEPGCGPSRGGRHVELGLAIAMMKKILIIGPKENIFCHLPNVLQIDYPAIETGLVLLNLVDESSLSISQSAGQLAYDRYCEIRHQDNGRDLPDWPSIGHKKRLAWNAAAQAAIAVLVPIEVEREQLSDQSQAIIDAIEKSPGIELNSLCAIAGVTKSPLCIRLRRLMKNGLIRFEKVGMRRQYFLATKPVMSA